MKTMLMLLVLVTTTQAQWRTVPFNKDKWMSNNGALLKYDKAEHFTGSLIINIAIDWKYAIALGFLWECKDAVMPYEKYGAIGGEGFSYKDLIADIAGVITWEIIYYCGKKFIHLIVR